MEMETVAIASLAPELSVGALAIVVYVIGIFVMFISLTRWSVRYSNASDVVLPMAMVAVMWPVCVIFFFLWKLARIGKAKP